MLPRLTLVISGIPLILWLCSCNTATQPKFVNDNQEQVFKSISKVFNYQLKNIPPSRNTSNWETATFYIGTIEAYKATGHHSFLDATIEWGQQNRWKTGSRKFNADDQAAGQVYLDLHSIIKDKKIIRDTQSKANQLIKSHTIYSNKLLWWWADALFMGPPVLGKLSEITGNDKYQNFADNQWWQSYKELYNPIDSLFVRDKKFNSHINEQNQKVYWLRGNGWAVAGLARFISSMPDTQKRESYINLYKAVMDKLLSLQQTDGLWRADLIRPEEYPIAETSGSSLICYTFAWGINNNVLTGEKYESALVDSWKGLKRHIEDNGKVTHVQTVGYRPEEVSSNNTEVFGSGTFLLAASEMYSYFGMK